jgi:hypothetical protein
MNRVLPEGLQEPLFRLISGSFSLVLATRDEEDPGKLGERIGATVRKHHTGMLVESEIDCVTGMKSTRTAILIRYTALSAALRKASIILSTLVTEHPSSCEVKDHLFGGTAGFYLDFAFYVCEVKDHLFGGTAGFYLEFPFSCTCDPLRFI